MKKILFTVIVVLSIAVVACKKDVKAPTDSGTPDPTPTPNPTPSGLAQKMLAKWTYYKKEMQNGSSTNTFDYADTYIEFKNDGTEVLTTPDPDPGATEPLVFTYTYKGIDETTFEYTNDNNVTYTCTVSQVDDHNLVYYYIGAGIKNTIYLSK